MTALVRTAALFAAAAFLAFWMTLLAAEVEAKPSEDGEATETPKTEGGKKSPTPTSTATPESTASATATPASSPSATPSPSPTATSSATTPAVAAAASNQQAREGKFIVHKRVYDAKKGDWKPASPAKSWTFEARDGAGNVIATFNDTDIVTVPVGTVVVSELASPPNPAGYTIFSFINSETGGSACPDTPTAGPTLVTLSANDFPTNGTVQLCAYNKGAETPKPKVKLSFVEAKAGKATWKLEPETALDILVWDMTAESCAHFNGAACGNLGADEQASGNFYAAPSGQYFLVTQSYVQDGESCEIEHQAEYALASDPGERLDVTGRYRCSGAPVLGPTWMALAFLAAVGVAWYVRRAGQQ